MKQVRNINLYGWGLGLLLALAACSDEETNLAPQEGNATMTFRLSTRADEEGAASTEQHTHLYVAERLSEHSGINNTTGDVEIPLYCDKDFVVDGNEYSVTNLLGQWYKFAFVCVPDLDEVKGMGEEMLFKRYNAETQKNEDFNNYFVFYKPVLEYQQDNYEKVAEQDLAIYRKIIDRWAIANSILEEDVRLTRVTGQLVLDMGKPADQFNEEEIDYINISFNTPISFYLRDAAKDSVIIMNNSLFTGSPMLFTIDWKPTSEEFKANERKIFTINLLPSVLRENANIKVVYKDRRSESYPLQNDEGEPIQIKPNTRTIVRFNGLHPEEFEVRYAGFADGNDAVVGVDDDKWNGNQLNKGDN